MLELNVNDETSPLKAVLLGTAKSNGPIPDPDDAYDPKSREHILAGTYPEEEDMVREMDTVVKVFEKYGVEVYRPEVIENCNQIFARDIAFVIEDKFIKSNILPRRDQEINAINNLVSQIDPDKVINLTAEAHIEGGDVILSKDYIFIGCYTGKDYSHYVTARTNIHAVDAIQKLFPEKKVKSFELIK